MHNKIPSVSITSYSHQGFTLVELVMVIVLLGIAATGVTSFIGLATQSYINITDRDELLANARFSVERLNREIRNALPNSVRIASGSVGSVDFQCIEFVPIKASTTYTDIPVAPESLSNVVKVIQFEREDGSFYQCDADCEDSVVVYPLNNSDVYDDQSDDTGKVFGINSLILPVPMTSELNITLDDAVVFDNESPTNRLYIVDKPVSYCLRSDQTMSRYQQYAFSSAQAIPPSPAAQYISLMANDLINIENNEAAFTVLAATLQRNALVQIKLHFSRNEEDFVFNNEVHVSNVP